MARENLSAASSNTRNQVERLFVTGDTHGLAVYCGWTNSLTRFSDEHLAKNGIHSAELGPADTFLVAGDLGWCWDGGERDSELLDMLQDRMEDLGGCVLAGIDGNHDNHAAYAEYPLVAYRGGHARRLRPNVYFLIRGEAYEFCGKIVWCLGGARSIDRCFRVEGETWWASEEISWAEEEHARKVLGEMDWKSDLVVTHTCPLSFSYAAGFVHAEDDPVAQILQDIYRNLDYKLWLCGHWHQDKSLPGYNACFLFEDIVKAF